MKEERKHIIRRTYMGLKKLDIKLTTTDKLIVRTTEHPRNTTIINPPASLDFVEDDNNVVHVTEYLEKMDITDKPEKFIERYAHTKETINGVTTVYIDKRPEVVIELPKKFDYLNIETNGAEVVLDVDNVKELHIKTRK